MSDLKTLLDQQFNDLDDIQEVKAMYTEIWKKDIRIIAALITEHIEDPESLLKHLAGHVQNARAEGFHRPLPH